MNAFTIKEIEEKMLSGAVSQMPPRELSELKVILSGHFSFTSHSLEKVLSIKPSVWMDFRRDARSDASTDRAWDATEDGLMETRCRMELKRIEKMLSSVSSILRVKEEESRHSF